MTLAIETQGLSHRFGAVEALRDVDLRTPEGSVYGFLGPNGSGKTTTIRILLGLLRPQSGRVRVLGSPMPARRVAIARGLGSMVETPCLYGHLDGFDNLDLTRRALGLDRRETERVLEVVDLAPYAFRPVAGYSLGMRQRLGIARALLGAPRLLILDEPMNGLDPAGVRDMRELIRALPERLGVTVFLSSHLIEEVELAASHVGLMFRGRLVAQSTPAELCAGVGRSIVIGVGDAERAAQRLRAAGLDCAVDGDLTVPLSPRQAPRASELNALLVGAGFEVFALEQRSPSLKDAFLHHTSALAA